MDVCDKCRSKGSCCKGFFLNFLVEKDNWYDESIKKLHEYNLEFMIPVRPLDYEQEKYISVMFDCSRLGADGLCTDYENRPTLCKLYEPRQDALCCEYVSNLNGIPIVVKGNQ